MIAAHLSQPMFTLCLKLLEFVQAKLDIFQLLLEYLLARVNFVNNMAQLGQFAGG